MVYKSKYICKLILSIIIMMAVVLPTVAMAADNVTQRPKSQLGVDGFLRLKYEHVTNDGEANSVSKNYFAIGLSDIVKGLSFNFYGQAIFGIDNEDDTEFNIYYGYLRYKTFQNALDISVGRFDLINNAFMTVDGAQVSVKTPYYFGVTIYGGIPNYKDFDDKKEIFRSTGDIIYGGRVFLSGVKNLNVYAGYSTEQAKGIFADSAEEETRTVNSTGSVGAFYLLDMSSNTIKKMATMAAIIENDFENNALSKVAIKGTYRYDFIQGSVFFDMFDVQDQYPKGRELIIQILSTGEETRYGADVAFNLSDWLNIHVEFIKTTVEQKSGTTLEGMIYKAGFGFYFMKTIGLIVDGDLYYYDTTKDDAMGGVLNIEWRASQDFAFIIDAEYALQSTERYGNESVYSVGAEFLLHLTRNLAVSLYYENGSSNNRFVDEQLLGAMVKYDF